MDSGTVFKVFKTSQVSGSVPAHAYMQHYEVF